MDGINDDDSRALRRLWFRYLDTIEPHRTALHGYALRLTGNLFDAEDLVQETLLRGYGMTGRGDLHGEASPVANARAYLFRTATHLYIDQMRRAQAAMRQAVPMPEPAPLPERDAARDGFTRLTALASPQERAAVVLKDVFDFTLDEAADFLRTSTGAVKAALHRGRERLAADDAALAASRRPSPAPGVLQAFVEAFNRRDIAAVVALLTQDCAIEVLGVGGGRAGCGQSDWVRFSMEETSISFRAGEVAGEAVAVAMVDDKHFGYLVRIEADEEERIGRIIDYCYATDTLIAAAREVGLKPAHRAYHQPPRILERMIASTTLPWRAG